MTCAAPYDGETGESDPVAAVPVSVLVVDDHPPILIGLRGIIGEQSGLVVCGEARTAAEAVRLANELRPDVVLMDTTLPDLAAAATIQALLKSHPGAHIVALCECADCATTPQLLDAGAVGSVSKSDSPETIAEAVRLASRGLVHLSPANAERLTHAFRESRSVARRRRELLNDLESRILVETASGFTAPEVAKRLKVSVSIVNMSRSRLMQKLDLHSRADMVHFALDAGLLVPDDPPA